MKVVPISVLPINVFLMISRKGGRHSCRHSIILVALRTRRDIFIGFPLGKIRRITRHQNIS
jgi:hypothetical protein